MAEDEFGPGECMCDPWVSALDMYKKSSRLAKDQELGNPKEDGGKFAMCCFHYFPVSHFLPCLFSHLAVAEDESDPGECMSDPWHLEESHQDVQDPRQQAQVRPQLHHDVRAEGGSFRKLV